MKVLATGATGTFAGLVVPALVSHGIDVRAVVHDPGKRDIPLGNGAGETVTADLGDPASLRAAFDGVDGAFLITPAFAPDATKMGLNFVEAAQAAGVRKIVYNGVYHPSLPLENHASTRPIEAALYASTLDFTILQPAMYMQGLDGAYEQALRTGAFAMPWSKHSKMTYVDYRDVAEAAALAFVDDRLSFGTFELAAPGTVDRVRLAELITEASGREVTAEDLPAGFTLPPGQPAGLGAMFAEYDRHGFHGGNPLVLRTILQREPRTLAAYVAELGATGDLQASGRESDR
ncbi:NmrA family NAD(P)-binding protein [Frankia sp. QA3]|uniref:NmrA family NAD(P)-binding protein n=1 Tax=Frankia sp. QA3 TaxID=710111 RepID=UPI000269BFA6|nr:NmrA family NAD(P)-binding protein [Frankia sp. QA3]EIV91527.1 putative nucleoside-diphosphate sugar epimerase [Frankia sp. QA3]